MLYSKYEWRTLSADAEISGQLAKELSVSPLIASLMAARGITSPEDGELFLNGTFDLTHDPFLMLGMNEAVPRIRKALEDKEHILIYGDYDADGVSSTSLMIYLMRHLGASYDIYIPHRSNEGYGLHNHALDWAHQQGVSLVITVDTGISAVEQIAYANELGMDVIVTDHHEPPEQLPDAYALINPKIPACPYPFKGLAGVGVAYKLAQALVGAPPQEWLEIVAIGTIADLMPLEGENRILVKNGLLSMRRTRYAGIRALLEVGGVNVDQVTAVNVAFAMAPRINASGRLDHAGRAVTLLTTVHQDEAERLAWELDALNKNRQQVVEQIVQESMDMIQRRWGYDQLPPVIVLAGEGWNVGVVGIVASKILERFYRPVVILGIDPDTGNCKGSARSIPGFDIYEALSSCKDVMHHFGGHPAAAGMSLHMDRLAEFEEGLCSFADVVLREEHFIPVYHADLECSIADVPLKVIDELEMLGPFGMSNAVPKMIFRGMEVMEVRKLGKENKHLKLRFQQNGDRLDAVAFGLGHLADVLPEGTKVDVLGELSVNEWNGSRKPQLMIQDMSVPYQQVFDYRGMKEPIIELKRWREILEPHLNCSAARSAVVFAQDSHDAIKSHLYDMSLWVYDRNAGILPMNPVAEKGGCESISVLFVLDVPESPGQLDSLLSSFRSVPNIFLLHPIRSKRDQLQIPTRDQFKKLYVMLAGLGSKPMSENEVITRMNRQSALSQRMLLKVLDVFEELVFIERSQGMITFVTKPDKKPLDASRHFRELSELAEMEQHLLHASTAQLTHWMMARSKGAS
ncbi:single-stranded-DNA-specific exonuclease RecJ [Paenibacillus sp. N3/727]|uniref:single-stranded-DNA-specific exonuclease RecJ n=1 Tax=Paenibacillus sp. N3/727 TaxID=2925845 RepID=UPI001F531A3E|nr:single-stranded-DNA-specific exonuclease RecJ [Paenibacillus sp. N3/727]UNK19878.1 single-stranded-DNA-specific exonuclease RecJ [Paenibacillus sp. N3/727]